MNLPPRPESSKLVRPRLPASYTEAEQRFSLFVQDRMVRLLRGKEDSFLLMRQYGGLSNQVAFFIPRSLNNRDLRCSVAENIIFGVLRFLYPYALGGPIAQCGKDGRLEEVQTFPTLYPHIVVERVDAFDSDTRQTIYTEWRALRLQNQRRSTLVNRALDFGNFALEISRFINIP